MSQKRNGLYKIPILVRAHSHKSVDINLNFDMRNFVWESDLAINVSDKLFVIIAKRVIEAYMYYI
jgi:hypothetical protein